MSLFRRVAIAFSVVFIVITAIFAAKVRNFGNAVSNSVNLLDAPRHPVTDPMWKNARAVAGKPAPNFTLQDLNSKDWTLSVATKEAPVVLVFTKDGCPCSIESQPFFNSIASNYAGTAKFVGVIDADKIVASKYRDDFKVPYEMILAGDGSVFTAYRSLQSVYTTLITKGGIVKKQWPGYSSATLVELNELLSQETGKPAAKLDLTMAPSLISSGCFFETPPTKSEK